MLLKILLPKKKSCSNIEYIFPVNGEGKVINGGLVNLGSIQPISRHLNMLRLGFSLRN